MAVCERLARVKKEISQSMESNQRKISFRMKKRGMHWSKEGAEAMVKVKQGILNGTLRNVYLASQNRSKRKQREVKRVVRMTEYLRQPTRTSIGANKYLSTCGPLFGDRKLTKIISIITLVIWVRYMGLEPHPDSQATKRQRGSIKCVQK